MRLLPYLVIFRSSLGHSLRHGWKASRHPPSPHLRHCPLPPGQPVTGSLWVPQSAAGPPLGGGAVADMKEGKAAMDWQTAWTVRVWGLGLTRGVGPRPALPVPLPTMATAAPPPQLPLPLLRQWLRVAQCLKDSDACWSLLICRIIPETLTRHRHDRRRRTPTTTQA